MSDPDIRVCTCARGESALAAALVKTPPNSRRLSVAGFLLPSPQPLPPPAPAHASNGVSSVRGTGCLSFALQTDPFPAGSCGAGLDILQRAYVRKRGARAVPLLSAAAPPAASAVAACTTRAPASCDKSVASGISSGRSDPEVEMLGSRWETAHKPQSSIWPSLPSS
jgi:hypothetical protein